MNTPLICIADLGTNIGILLGNPLINWTSHVHKKMAVYFILQTMTMPKLVSFHFLKMARCSEDSLEN